MADDKNIRSLLDEALGEKVFSGYQCLAVRGDKRLAISGGVTSYWPGAKPVTDRTLFDIGSITKVVNGLSSLAPLLEKGTIRLEQRLEERLKKLEKTALAPIAVGELLNHVSGLIDWMPFFRETESDLVKYLLDHEKEIVQAKPRERAKYSDLNFWLLGLFAQGLAPKFDETARKLGMASTRFGPVKAEESVATEFCLWRRRVCHGEVFDENCFKMGGSAFHAGLFSTASDLGRFAEEWLAAWNGKSKWLGREWAHRLTTPPRWVGSNTFGLGWDTPSPANSTAGDKFSRKSFGHLGFTGTSLWIDPEAGGYTVFLTNRIHPSRYDGRIRKLRPALHDAVYDWWEDR